MLFDIFLLYDEYQGVCELLNISPENIMNFMEYLDVICKSGHEHLMFVLLHTDGGK